MGLPPQCARATADCKPRRPRGCDRNGCSRLGAEWPPAWGDDLAAAYLNRGMTQEVGQDPEAALADWGLSRDLRATLLAALGDDSEQVEELLDW